MNGGEGYYRGRRQSGRMEEKAANSIPVEQFETGKDFDEWIEMFESAVVVATKVTDPARKLILYKTWLPLKLDEQARMAYKGCTSEAWADLKKELSGMLIDPSEKCAWRSGKKKIVWDGKQPLPLYAMSIKKAVKRFHDPPREYDYYEAFKLGLPADYQENIDVGATAETIEEALRVAQKIHVSRLNRNASETGASGKAVSFAGASMSEDRLKTLELNMQSMALENKNMLELQQQQHKNMLELNKNFMEEVMKALKSRDRQPSGSRDNDSGSRNYPRRDSRDRQSNDRGQGRSPDTRYRSPGRQQDGGHYSRRDDRRDSGNRDQPRRSQSPGRDGARSSSRGRDSSRDRRQSPGRNYDPNNRGDRDRSRDGQQGAAAPRQGTFNAADLQEMFLAMAESLNPKN